MRKKTITVMQPALFPWLGYFDLIDQSEIFVLYNNVQFSKQNRETRNKIPTANGVMNFSVPTIKCDLGTTINNVFLDTKKDWNKKFFKTLQLNYPKAKFYNEVIEWFYNFLNREFIKLQDLNIAFIKEISQKIGINTTFKLGSDLCLNNNDRIGRLIEICELHSYNTYLSTTGSFGYLYEENGSKRFQEKKIEILFHNYNPTKYETGKLPFESYMSIIDALFHCGFDDTLSIVKSGRKESYKFEEYKDIALY